MKIKTDEEIRKENRALLVAHIRGAKRLLAAKTGSCESDCSLAACKGCIDCDMSFALGTWLAMEEAETNG